MLDQHPDLLRCLIRVKKIICRYVQEASIGIETSALSIQFRIRYHDRILQISGPLAL